MDYITSWISEIILLILMAVVLELLLPNSDMQRYVRMVVGLLLLLALLKPVLSVFEVDPDDILDSFTSSAVVSQEKVKNSIENKKIEIQASSRAYIKEQMAVRLKKKVKEKISEHFHLAISNIVIKLKEDGISRESGKAIQHIDVVLKEEEGSSNETIDPIESVTINTTKGDDKGQTEDNREDQIRSFLAEQWEMPSEKITVTLEGGKDLDDDP